jgi:uncharacterized SAM-binding protein YcdF (DUF218 family)
MDIFLTALLARVVRPLAAGLALQAVGLVAWARGHRKAAAAAIGTGFAVLLFASLPAGSNGFRGRVERLYLPLPMEAIPTADAIVVLGGGIGPPLPPRRSADLGPAADRVLHAARLYRAGKAPVVIASGGTVPWRASGTEGAHSMRGLLVEWGVPREAIIEEAASHDTHTNCVRTRELAEQRGYGRVLLVTSALHMRRALATCRSAGLDAVPAPTDYAVVDGRGDDPLRYVPTPTALNTNHQVLRELLGYAVYRFRGWITDAGTAPLRPEGRSQGRSDEPDAGALDEVGDAPGEPRVGPRGREPSP